MSLAELESRALDFINNETPIAMLLAGILASLITYWGSEKKLSFWKWALPTSIINGVFGTSIMLLVYKFYPTLNIATLLFLSASAGSIGKNTLIGFIKGFYIDKMPSSMGFRDQLESEYTRNSPRPIDQENKNNGD